MAFLRRRRRLHEPNLSREAWAQREWREGPDAPWNLVAGEDRHQELLRSIVKRLTGEKRWSGRGYLIPVVVVFIREDDNEYDPNAWRAELDGQPIGYLRRHAAEAASKQCDPESVTRFEVAGLIRGGFGKKADSRLGVHVWPDQTLTQAPAFSRGPKWVVQWPPNLIEGLAGDERDAITGCY